MQRAQRKKLVLRAKEIRYDFMSLIISACSACSARNYIVIFA